MRKYNRSPSEKQGYRQQCAKKLAEILRPGDLDAVSMSGHADRGLYYSALLNLEAQEDNHVIQTATQSDERGGGTYEQGAALYRPSLRISPTYSQEIRRRATREAKAGILRAEKTLTYSERIAKTEVWRGSYQWRHLTLTMQHGEAATTFDEVRRFNRAFGLLRKRELWSENVRAGIKGVEDRLTWRGSHVHGHLMILSKYLDQAMLQREWEDCLGCKGIIQIQLIKDRRPFGDEGGPECSLQHALSETTKYITKTSDLLEPDSDGRVVSRDQLMALCDVLRWPRMFELLGACRQTRGIPGREAALLSILPEYPTAARMGTCETDVTRTAMGDQFIVYVNGLDSDLAKQWRILDDGEIVILADTNAGPPWRKKKRPLSWRELMLRLEPWRWFETIERRCTKMMEQRKYFLERKTGYPVYCIFDGMN